MGTKLQITTKLDQRLLLNQQMKQAIGLLQSTTLELKQQVLNWLETNPLIEIKEELNEEENTDEMIHYSNTRKEKYFESTENTIENIEKSMSLREYLLEQTLDCHWNDRGLEVAEAIIDNIDENGYLTVSLEEIQASLEATLHVTLDEVKIVLKTIQGFEPIGIAAHTAKESLLIQLEHCDERGEDWIAAKTVLLMENIKVEDLNLKKMVKESGLTQDQLVSAFQLIKTLHLNPGKQYAGQKEISVEPELEVKKKNGVWVVSLVSHFLSRVDINKEYQKIIKSHSKDKSFKSISAQLQEAKLLISSLKRRNDTLLSVANYIIEKQGDFFESGESAMRPMNLAEAALALNCHESTISRITTGKYMATPRGLFELKHFFPSHLRTVEGRVKSSIAVKDLMTKYIQTESKEHAYSDDEIMRYLNQSGITISRRTVTKYREALNIPSSYERQQTNWMNINAEHYDEFVLSEG